MDKITKLASQLIQIHSTYPNEHKMGEYIKSLFKEKKYSSREQQVEGKRKNIIVEKGKGDKTIILYSHLDTVPVVDGWKTNPLKPALIGDKLYGLGAYDMKGGMAVNINTFLQYEPKNIKLQLLFCVDEENISKGGYVFAKSEEMKDISCVLSPEPAFKYGENGIVTGRIGRAVIQIHLHMVPLHFYYYEPRFDISITAFNIINQLKKMYKNNKGKKEFVFVRSVHAQSKGMSTPHEVFIELDASILPPTKNKDLLLRVSRIIKECVKKDNIKYDISFKERETPFLTGYQIKEDNQLLQYMRKSVKKITGKKAASYFRSSVADENIFGSAGKTVLGIGPSGGNAHAPDEWVSIQSLEKLSRIYSDFLLTVDNSTL